MTRLGCRKIPYLRFVVMCKDLPLARGIVRHGFITSPHQVLLRHYDRKGAILHRGGNAMQQVEEGATYACNKSL